MDIEKAIELLQVNCADCSRNYDFTCSGARSDYCNAKKLAVKVLQNKVLSNQIRLRRGIANFAAEYIKQSYEEATENNCELIDWIQSRIEKEFETEEDCEL